MRKVDGLVNAKFGFEQWRQLFRWGLFSLFIPIGLGCQTIPERTYDVHGNTTQDLIFDLKDNPVGPKDSWGHRGAAITLCQVRFSLKGEQNMRGKPARCSCTAQVKEILLDSKIEITMPRWVERKNASSDCQDKWDIFLEATRHHEKGHVDICKEGVETIKKRLDKASGEKVKKSARECEAACKSAWGELKNKMEQIYKKNFNKLQQRQIDYDKKTQHGQTQGGNLESCGE